jgi:hypothetical protein
MAASLIGSMLLLGLAVLGLIDLAIGARVVSVPVLAGRVT